MTSKQFHIGFLTALGIPERNFVAGLLVTNRFGRPLEFQCTTPVKPNRTQEILYGPTLVPFILGELLGKTLIEKVSIKPNLVVTDHVEIHELRNHIDCPVICLAQPADSTEKTSQLLGVDDVNKLGQDLNSSTEPVGIDIGGDIFQVHREFPSDAESVSEVLKSMKDCEPDFAEPLERVREALSEALNLSKAA